jgi:oligopeptide/dipeptide ABC transporter ATP-binding protein
VTSGRILFNGRDITHARPRERRALSSQVQVVFQDPYSSLNPTRTVGQTLGEMLRPQRLQREDVKQRVAAMLERVGLEPDAARRYPTQFSGGQRQRIAIARALIVGPRVVICDEPVSALDLSVQAQILNLLIEIQQATGVSYLFISHDLSVVRYMAQRIVVLYRGRVMEQGAADSVYDQPSHPYTMALRAAAPVPDPAEQRARRTARRALKTDQVAMQSQTRGCPFAPRCGFATDHCYEIAPNVESTREGVLVACHHWRGTKSDRLKPAPDAPADPEFRATDGGLIDDRVDSSLPRSS